MRKNKLLKKKKYKRRKRSHRKLRRPNHKRRRKKKLLTRVNSLWKLLKKEKGQSQIKDKGSLLTILVPYLTVQYLTQVRVKSPWSLLLVQVKWSNAGMRHSFNSTKELKQPWTAHLIMLTAKKQLDLSLQVQHWLLMLNLLRLKDKSLQNKQKKRRQNLKIAKLRELTRPSLVWKFTRKAKDQLWQPVQRWKLTTPEHCLTEQSLTQAETEANLLILSLDKAWLSSVGTMDSFSSTRVLKQSSTAHLTWLMAREQWDPSLQMQPFSLM